MIVYNIHTYIFSPDTFNISFGTCYVCLLFHTHLMKHCLEFAISCRLWLKKLFTYLKTFFCFDGQMHFYPPKLGPYCFLGGPSALLPWNLPVFIIGELRPGISSITVRRQYNNDEKIETIAALLDSDPILLFELFLKTYRRLSVPLWSWKTCCGRGRPHRWRARFPRKSEVLQPINCKNLQANQVVFIHQDVKIVWRFLETGNLKMLITHSFTDEIELFD